MDNLPDLTPLVREELSDLLNIVLNREQREGKSRAEQNALAMAIECGMFPCFKLPYNKQDLSQDFSPDFRQ